MTLKDLLILLPSFILIVFSMITFLSASGLKYSKRRTVLIVIPFLLVLLGLDVIIYKNVKFSTFDALSEFIFFIPEFILTIFLAKRKGISLIVSMIAAYVSFYMIILLTNIVGIYIKIPYIQYFVYILFIPFITLYLQKFYNPFHDEIEKLIPKFLILLGVYSIFILVEFYLYRFLISDTTQRVLRLEIFGVAIISVYIISLSFFSLLLKNYRNTYIKANNKELVDKQLESMLKQYSMIESREKEVTIMRHDLKHVLITASTLIQNKQYDEALEIINSQTKQIDQAKIIKYCHDPIINAIIGYYKNLCKQKNIGLKLRIKNIDKALKLKSSDLAILISNCFDNAINASEKLKSNKLIDFKFINTNDNLVLQIKNNYDGNITLDKNNIPTSLKQDHGIGTQSIASFCKKNKLILDYDITDTTFTLGILF